MAETLNTKVLIIGGGTGGYVAGIRCGQLGLDTVLVDGGDGLGGTCLIVGCIPSKAIIHAAGQVRDGAQGRRRRHAGHHRRPAGHRPVADGRLEGRHRRQAQRRRRRPAEEAPRSRSSRAGPTFTDAKTCTVKTADGDIIITAEHVILATGSEPVELPFLKFGGDVISSTEALSLRQVPEKLVVVGGGYIGLELGIAFRKLGAEVAIVEMADRILPLYDKALTDPVQKWLEKHGVELHLGAKAGSFEDGQLNVTDEGRRRPIQLEADKVLVTVGRRPRTQGWGLENMGVAMAGPFVKIDDRCATSMKNVWAVGDLVGEPMLAHKGSAQGEVVAEIIAGHDRRFDPVTIAAVCFTEPEIVSAGLGPQDVEGRDDVIQAVFPLRRHRPRPGHRGRRGRRLRPRPRVEDRPPHPRHPGRRPARLRAVQQLRPDAGDGRGAGRRRRHHPRPPDPGRSLPRGRLRALGHAIHI